MRRRVVYHASPLVCNGCGHESRIIDFGKTQSHKRTPDEVGSLDLRLSLARLTLYFAQQAFAPEPF